MRSKYYLIRSFTIERGTYESLCRIAAETKRSRSHIVGNALYLYIKAFTYDQEKLERMEKAYDLQKSPRLRKEK